MLKYLFFTLCISLNLLIPNLACASDTPNWKVVYADDPTTRKKTCLMMSASKRIEDGQSTTPVHLIYNGHIFFAKTKSNIDLSYPGLGLKVDNHSQHKISALYKETSAVFTLNTIKIRDQFISGLDAELTLGFWPSWPKTRSFTSHFNLHEFSDTYKRFLKCKKNGDID